MILKTFFIQDFLLIALILVIIFLLVYLFFKNFNKNFIFQIKNKYNIISNNLIPNKINNFYILKHNFNILNNNSHIYTLKSNVINILLEGVYEISFSISASKRLNFDNLILFNEEQLIEEEELFVDSYVEWKINNLVTIPVFSENRTDGPENIMTFKTFIKVESVPYKINFTYKNLDNRIVNNYVINDFIFSVEKKNF